MNPLPTPARRNASPLLNSDELSFELAAEKFMTPSRFYGWLECADGTRKQSYYWGLISNAELGELLLKEMSGEQFQAAMKELKDRFIAEHCMEIAAVQTESMEWPADRRDDVIDVSYINDFASGPLVLDGERRGV